MLNYAYDTLTSSSSVYWGKPSAQLCMKRVYSYQLFLKHSFYFWHGQNCVCATDACTCLLLTTETILSISLVPFASLPFCVTGSRVQGL